MKNYLRTFSIQRSATEGTRQTRQDRELGEAIKGAAEGGLIDADQMDRQIAPLFTDRGRVAKSESGLVDLLDAARDGRRRSEIDGVRIRMTPDAERRFVHHRAALDAKIAPKPGLSEAQFGAAAAKSAQAWYRQAVTAAWADIEADDPELFDGAARDRDLATAARITFGGADEAAVYGLLPERREDTDFYAGRAFFTPAGDPVPREQVRLHRLNHEPEYAGQVLTSLLAFDRRDGSVLAHLWTVD